MEKTPSNNEKDLSRLAGLIADIRYAEPPDALAERIMAGITPKEPTWVQRLLRRLRTPMSVTPLRLVPAGVSLLVVFIAALTLFGPSPDQRGIRQRLTEEGIDQGLKTVMLVLDRPDARDVEVIGSFNNWSREGIRMVRDKDHGVWVVVLHLKRGSYEYAFRVNQEEIVEDPKAIMQRDDGFGHKNSILIIENGNGKETKI